MLYHNEVHITWEAMARLWLFFTMSSRCPIYCFAASFYRRTVDQKRCSPYEGLERFCFVGSEGLNNMLGMLWPRYMLHRIKLKVMEVLTGCKELAMGCLIVCRLCPFIDVVVDSTEASSYQKENQRPKILHSWRPVHRHEI